MREHVETSMIPWDLPNRGFLAYPWVNLHEEEHSDPKSVRQKKGYNYGQGMRCQESTGMPGLGWIRDWILTDIRKNPFTGRIIQPWHRCPVVESPFLEGLKSMLMWHLGTWACGGRGSDGGMTGLNGPGELFQPEQFHDSMDEA